MSVRQSGYSKKNKVAFLLALNQLTNRDNVALALTEHPPRLMAWLGSDTPGYFFLDAVDESRLNSPTALKTALRLVLEVLQSHLQRVSFIISSRVTDWSVPGVRETVERTLLKAIREAEASDVLAPGTATATLDLHENEDHPSIELGVFRLDELSKEDAKRLAEAHGASPAGAFWEAVEDGGYEFMATRPLDLEWMAKRWASVKKLGTYSDLIEAALLQRLSEKNPSYIDSGAVLSRDQLRQGAEQIAAACIFSGRPYVLVNPGASTDNAIAPAEALPDWNPQEHLRLLGTAVFDDKTYGRVKFHHRAVREYLAACWVMRRINEGLPVSRALELFMQTPYREPVLLNSRQSVLCWLASLNAEVRERVIRQFPEMLMFEGDPERWSADDAAEAFAGYIRRLESGYRPNWINGASELRRVARTLPPGLLADYLTRYSNSSEAVFPLLLLVEYGRVMSCADAVFALYRDPGTSPRHRYCALRTLATVATPEQRTAIADDLVSGKLKTNELIGEAFKAVNPRSLTVEQITAVFQHTHPESEFGGGPMAMAVKFDLLPTLDVQTLHTLLYSILAALPTSSIQELTHRAEAGKRREGWMLSVLPDCLLRALELMTGEGADAPQVLVDSALVVEKLRHTTYANYEDFRSLRPEIEKHCGFKRRVALSIAYSEDIRNAVMSLIRGSGLVCFTGEDLDRLIHEAIRGDIDAAERRIWYQIARDVAVYQVSGKRRQRALAALSTGPDGDERREDIAIVRAQRVESVQTRRGWKREARQRKVESRHKLEESKAQLLECIESIRDGSATGAIQWLIARAAERGTRRSDTKVSLEPIARDLGNELAEAFSEGLTKVWRQIEVPNPAMYPDGQVSGFGLMGLAGVNHAVSKGLGVQGLSAEEVTRAVQFCVWDFHKPEPWFDSLASIRPEIVVAALMPWFEHELGLPGDDERIRRTVDTVLQGPEPLQRPFLDRAVALMRGGQVFGDRLQMRLLRATAAAGMACVELIADLASRKLLDRRRDDTPIFASEWFGAWAAADLPGAWSWVETNSAAVAKEAPQLARLIAGALEDPAWTKGLSGTEAEARALVSLFRFLSPHADAAQPRSGDDEDSSLPHEVQRLRNNIPAILASLTGKSAHAALVELASEHAGTRVGAWLQGFVRDHASVEAERRCIVSPTDLPVIGEAYWREPRCERELFTQVIARLEEIRAGVEGGPFSDRALFYPRMDEKKLQLWLAARLSDTPRRRFIPRFVAHREPQVDEDKRTDIEVSSAAGKVCIEIKPVDRQRRHYSANSLTDPMRNQLVGQYLRGQNSKHGVLVVFRLDDKKWQIPDGPARGDFGELIRYLEQQAAAIRTRNADIDGLQVLGFDCVPP